ncbi:hypothetical protein GF389_03650 [Candidatus Dojkabacteria bacterium]|nr:hypothetical protein [Candidatus Dojkabacteria bacterium]
MKKYFSMLLTILFILMFIGYLLHNPDLILNLQKIDPIYLVIVGTAQLVIIFSNGLFTRIALQLFNKKIGYSEAFYISLISTIGNYFTPFRGGAGVRAIYLKKRLGFSYSHFISTLSGYYIITFFINSLIGLSALVYISAKDGQIPYLVIFFFTIVFALTSFLIIFSPPSRLLRTISVKNVVLLRIRSILINTLEGWKLIIGNFRILLKLIFIASATYIAVMVIAATASISLDLHLSFVQLAFYAALGNMTLLISITPGSIGIKESVYILTSEIINLTNENILQIALIDRGTLFVVIGGVYLLYLVKNIKNSIE